MDELLKNWPFVLATLGFAGWLVRLEQKILQVERQVNEDRHDFKNIFEKIDNKIDRMAENIVELKVEIAKKGGRNAAR